MICWFLFVSCLVSISKAKVEIISLKQNFLPSFSKVYILQIFPVLWVNMRGNLLFNNGVSRNWLKQNMF